MTMNILIIGVASAIAQATAREYATQGHRLYIVARNSEQLSVIANDLKIRGAVAVDTAILDVSDFSMHSAVIDKAYETLKNIDIALIAYGTLPDQKALEKNVNDTLASCNINALSIISLLTLLANRFESQKSGTIAVITSVAGDRGRQSNYIYGACKGMVSIFLSGLRNRLFDSHVNVLDVKPGFVDTPMTAHIKKDGPLWAKPDAVAKDIIKAIAKKKAVLYTPFFWRYIMLIIRNIPECLFKKGKL